MDEFLSEREQLQRIRDWWRENGWYLLAGAALGVVALFGFNQYRGYTEARAEVAASLYLDMQDVIEDNDQVAAEAILVELREEHASSPYADQAGLLMAGVLFSTQPARAADELRFVMENTQDSDLSRIARLRLARLMIYQDEPAQALELLNIANLGPFTAQYSEIRGDAHYSLGNNDAARDAYEEALLSVGAEWVNRTFIEMKLDSLEVTTADEETGT